MPNDAVACAQPPSAASGRRRRLLASGSPGDQSIYDVGGAQHVAVNTTIYAAHADLLTAQTLLSQTIPSEQFRQDLNRSGAAKEGSGCHGLLC